MKRTRALLAVLLFAGLAACGAPQAGSINQEQMSQANLQADLSSLKSRTQEMRMRIEELESAVGKQGRGLTLEDVNRRLAQLEAIVNRMAATLGVEGAPRASSPSTAAPAASPQTVAPSYGSPSSKTDPYAAYGSPEDRSPDSSAYGGPSRRVETAPTGPITMGPDSTDPAEAIYNMGMEAYNLRDYDRANTLFSELQKSYPTSRQAPDALFWQAESNYQQGDYGRAALICQDLISKFPHHPIVPSAMLKQAMSFRRLGKGKAATILLQDVVKRYPGSPEAKSAQAQLREQ